MTLTVEQLIKRVATRKPLKAVDILRKAMPGPELVSASYTITNVSADDQRLVTGQVYAPNTVDAHGHFMTAKELQRTAHQFMIEGLTTSIDVQHDNLLIDATIVETFIARAGDPEFEEGAWVAVTKIHDPLVWQMVKNGQINGYSFEILTYRQDMVVEIEYQSWYYGFTDPDPRDKHTHPFMVRMDDNGEIEWGQTGLGSDGSSSHIISRSNLTNAASGHTHRYHLRDQ